MITTRGFNGKMEDVLATCEFVAAGVERDKKDFLEFSPKFDEPYFSGFQLNIQKAKGMVTPIEQTRELKIVTARLYGNLEKLSGLLDRVGRYVEMAGDEMPVSVKELGITALKKKIYNKNAEGVVADFAGISRELDRYETLLAEQGLSTEMKTELLDTVAAINADNVRQFEVISDRNRQTESNTIMFNALYKQMQEICKTGKMLYKKVSPEKVQDYTFAYLLRKARVERNKNSAQG